MKISPVNNFSRANYPKTNKQNSVSFGLNIVKDKDYNDLINYWTSHDIDSKEISDFTDRLSKLRKENGTPDEYKITFSNIYTKKDYNDYYVEEGIWSDTKVWGVRKNTISYQFSRTDNPNTKSKEYYSFLSSDAYTKRGQNPYKFYTRPLGPSALLREIRNDFERCTKSYSEF